MSRRPIAAGNWKMHLRASQARAFCSALREARLGDDVEVLLFPSFPLLAVAADMLPGSGVGWGGQDLHQEASGAHTGDVAGEQLVDLGCEWVLVGHSERRRDHGEDDALVAAKAARALDAGLTPVVCLGESADERRAGDTYPVLERQLGAVTAAARRGIVVAYEPVWAIGTGDTATPDQAQEAHAFLRRRLAELAGSAVGASTRILYGGSVKPANAAELAARPDIDGFLVGGASLDVNSFLGIIGALRPDAAPPTGGSK